MATILWPLEVSATFTGDKNKTLKLPHMQQLSLKAVISHLDDQSGLTLIQLLVIRPWEISLFGSWVLKLQKGHLM